MSVLETSTLQTNICNHWTEFEIITKVLRTIPNCEINRDNGLSNEFIPNIKSASCFSYVLAKKKLGRKSVPIIDLLELGDEFQFLIEHVVDRTCCCVKLKDGE